MERILFVHSIGILSGETPLPGRMPQSPGDPASPNDKICRRTKGRAVGPDGGGLCCRVKAAQPARMMLAAPQSQGLTASPDDAGRAAEPRPHSQSG